MHIFVMLHNIQQACSKYCGRAFTVSHAPVNMCPCWFEFVISSGCHVLPSLSLGPPAIRLMVFSALFDTCYVSFWF